MKEKTFFIVFEGQSFGEKIEKIVSISINYVLANVIQKSREIQENLFLFNDYFFCHIISTYF